MHLVNSVNGYALCPTCKGHGHLFEEFYSEDPIHSAAIVKVGDAGAFFVPLGEAPVIFGRFPPPYANVRLFDSLITKRHFEISWNASVRTHEVYDFGRYSLMLDGQLLAGTLDRVSSHAEPLPGDRRLLGFGNILQIGQYSIEYVLLANDTGATAG